jgi:hypothetical protein
MIAPATVLLRARRGSPFVDFIQVRGADLTGAAAAMQVRLYTDAPGDPLIDLTLTTAPDEGLSIEVETVEGVPVSTLWIRIDETTLEDTLPFIGGDGQPTRKAGTDVSLVWDMPITPSGGIKGVWFRGDFIIEGAVTV